MNCGHPCESNGRARFGRAQNSLAVSAPPFRAAPLVLLLSAALALAACGPTAEQANARQNAGPSSAPAAPAPRAARSAPEEPVPEVPAPSAAPEAPRVGVSGSQAGMPQPVQDACQFLLRRDPARLPPGEAGDCVRAAMAAGGGATQTVTTASSWIPQGTHTVVFTTAPDFSLTLENPELGLRITAGAGGSSVDTGAGRINANESGSPEEAYAAVLAHAAELTANPDAVADLLKETAVLEVDYGAVLNGAVRTHITGYRSVAANADDMMPTGVSLWLDDYYRPVRFELTGQTRGITSSITAVNGVWRQ